MKMKANKSSLLLVSPHAGTLSQSWFQPSIRSHSLSLWTPGNGPSYSQSPQLPSFCNIFMASSFSNAIKIIVLDKNHCILYSVNFLTWLRKASHLSWDPYPYPPLPTMTNICPRLYFYCCIQHFGKITREVMFRNMSATDSKTLQEMLKM